MGEAFVTKGARAIICVVDRTDAVIAWRNLHEVLQNVTTNVARLTGREYDAAEIERLRYGRRAVWKGAL